MIHSQLAVFCSCCCCLGTHTGVPWQCDSPGIGAGRCDGARRASAGDISPAGGISGGQQQRAGGVSEPRSNVHVRRPEMAQQQQSGNGSGSSGGGGSTACLSKLYRNIVLHFRIRMALS